MNVKYFVILSLLQSTLWVGSLGTKPGDAVCFTQHHQQHSNPLTGDGGFEITIRDMHGRMADRFEGGHTYKVILGNSMSGMIFQDFSIYASTDMKNDMTMSMDKMPSSKTIGQLVVSRKYGQLNPKCHNNVHGVDNKVYTRVEVHWQAPEHPIKCIKFQAQIVKHRSMVFEDVGGLMKTICPTKMHKMVSSADDTHKISQIAYDMPPMVKECCACGTASYKVTFSGLWSNDTHPTDWPKHKSMLHWTNLIGATHNGNYFIYYTGGQASQAVQSICSYGDNTVLKQNFGTDSAKPNLKSFFSTPGMWNEDELKSSRSGLISVNRTHHLFSFLTMMGPSPDWCTGIPALDLCMSDCSWKKNLTIDLYPFDAGIKHGDTYMPLNSDRLDIPEPIKVINTTLMKEYPFTPNSPVARVVIERIKPLYDWQCTKMSAKGVEEFDSMAMSSAAADNSNENSFLKQRQKPNANSPLNDPALAQMATFLCITSSWSLWSTCSVSCGVGSRTRTKVMIKNLKNELCRHVPLVETETCEGRQRACDFSAPCSVLSWSSWSPCNATCEKDGVQHRMRMFARESEKESCMRKMGSAIKLSEYRQCMKEKSHCDPVTICSEGLVVGLKCWKAKTRFYYDAMKHACFAFEYLGCKGSLNNFVSKTACESMCLKAVENLPQWRREKMAMLQFQSQSQSNGGNEHKKKSPAIAKQCHLPVTYGSMTCNTSVNEDIRYYYDKRNFRCRQFMFSGCHGNSNNFVSYSSCMKACMPEKIMMMSSAPKRDCELTGWSSWGPCSSRCGMGKQWRWRNVIKPSMNGGTACPNLYMTRSCISNNC